jgi:hypothetical protein
MDFLTCGVVCIGAAAFPNQQCPACSMVPTIITMG